MKTYIFQLNPKESIDTRNVSWIIYGSKIQKQLITILKKIVPQDKEQIWQIIKFKRKKNREPSHEVRLIIVNTHKAVELYYHRGNIPVIIVRVNNNT